MNEGATRASSTTATATTGGTATVARLRAYTMCARCGTWVVKRDALPLCATCYVIVAHAPAAADA